MRLKLVLFSHIQCLPSTTKSVIGSAHNGARLVWAAFCHCSNSSSHEYVFPSQWYEEVFPKLSKLSHLLKNVDMVDGRLIDVNDHSTVRDENTLRRMLNFKAIARVFLGVPSVQEELRRNIEVAMADTKHRLPVLFSKSSEREPMIISSLKPISDFFGVTAQQRKVLRLTVCSHVAQHQILTSVLEEILKGLKLEMEYLKSHGSTEVTRMGEQIVSGCLKFLSETANCHDQELSSWMKPKPIRVVHAPSPSHKWEEVLEMFNDLINCLRDEEEVWFHVSKLEVMREGLSQIKDLSVDKRVPYKEVRHQESLVHKRLVKTLGHSSRCLFTLLQYYLYGTISDMDVDVSGGLHQGVVRGKFFLCMGKFVTSDEENMIWSGIKQLDRSLGLFKFVWETARMKGSLVLQGHIWCVGAQHRTLAYRGNTFFVHGINL